jgi:hypothetical protein
MEKYWHEVCFVLDQFTKMYQKLDKDWMDMRYTTSKFKIDYVKEIAKLSRCDAMQ